MTSDNKTNIGRHHGDGDNDGTTQNPDRIIPAAGDRGKETDGTRTSGKSNNQGENPGGGDRNKGAGDHTGND